MQYNDSNSLLENSYHNLFTINFSNFTESRLLRNPIQVIRNDDSKENTETKQTTKIGGLVKGLKPIIAGGVAGGIEIMITYPTEFVKTQMQLYESVGNKGALACVQETISTRGVFGLYKGLAPLLYFSIPKSAVRFGAFEKAKEFLKDDQGNLSVLNNGLAGLVAGVSEAILIVTPMETMKVKLIHDTLSPNPQYKNFIHGITSIAKEKGFKGLYAGLNPTILKQGSNQAIRFGIFGVFRQAFHPENPQQKLPVHESLIFGGIAGAASVFGNTPVDVVKTRMQGLEAKKYKGSIDCAMKIWKTEGFKGFYKGTTPRLARVTIDVGIQMTIFQQVMQFFDHYWPN